MPKLKVLTNQALALFHVYVHPRSTLREISQAIGITERATLANLRQLEEEGLVSRVKEGRQNRYTVDVPAVMSLQTLGPYSVEQVVRLMSDLADQLPGAEDPDPPAAEQPR